MAQESEAERRARIQREEKLDVRRSRFVGSTADFPRGVVGYVDHSVDPPKLILYTPEEKKAVDARHRAMQEVKRRRALNR